MGHRGHSSRGRSGAKRIGVADARLPFASLAIPAAAHAADPTRIKFINDGSGKCLERPPGNGYYNVFNTQSGLCLDVTGGGTADGTPTQQWDCNNTPNQQWSLDYQGEFVRLISVNSGKCLDVRNGSHDDHAIVQQWTCNGTAAQRWSQVYVIFF